MLKQKAPKDMTVEEFIDLVERRYGTKEPTNMSVWINTLRMIADEPAPNPFAPDQLAWMREEQRNGYRYAASDRDRNCYLFTHKPIKEDHCWELEKQDHHYSDRRDGFLESILSFDDPEPLCFADYAPLEENK